MKPVKSSISGGGLKVTRVFNNTSTYLQILSPTPATVEPREAEAAASTLN